MKIKFLHSIVLSLLFSCSLSQHGYAVGQDDSPLPEPLAKRKHPTNHRPVLQNQNTPPPSGPLFPPNQSRNGRASPSKQRKVEATESPQTLSSLPSLPADLSSHTVGQGSYSTHPYHENQSSPPNLDLRALPPFPLPSLSSDSSRKGRPKKNHQHQPPTTQKSQPLSPPPNFWVTRQEDHPLFQNFHSSGYSFQRAFTPSELKDWEEKLMTATLEKNYDFIVRSGEQLLQVQGFILSQNLMWKSRIYHLIGDAHMELGNHSDAREKYVLASRILETLIQLCCTQIQMNK